MKVFTFTMLIHSYSCLLLFEFPFLLSINGFTPAMASQSKDSSTAAQQSLAEVQKQGVLHHPSKGSHRIGCTSLSQIRHWFNEPMGVFPQRISVNSGSGSRVSHSEGSEKAASGRNAPSRIPPHSFCQVTNHRAALATNESTQIELKCPNH